MSQHDNIPPNSNLVYEVKLMRVVSTRFGGDIAAINAYLQARSIIPQIDQSGIRYKIISIDSAALSPPKPLLSDSVVFTYTSKILNAVSSFDSIASPTKVLLQSQVLTAWKIILPQITEGSRVAMYVPSGYGYGGNATAFSSRSGVITVPANANLEIDFSLIKVIHH